VASDFVDDELLGDLDEIRGIPGELGLRPFSVQLEITTWTGARAGLPGPGTGGSTVAVVALYNTGPNPQVATVQPVQVRQLTRQEVISSGGLYTNRDLKVGPLTPQFAAALTQPGGGYLSGNLDPEATITATEIYWRVTGPGFPAAGAIFEKLGQESTALHHYLILRQQGHQP
jgi:hypothetical protein